MFLMAGSRSEGFVRPALRVPVELQSVSAHDNGSALQVDVTFPLRPKAGSVLLFFVVSGDANGLAPTFDSGLVRLFQRQNNTKNLTGYARLVQRGDTKVTWTFGQNGASVADAAGIGIELADADFNVDVSSVNDNSSQSANIALQLGGESIQPRSVPAIIYGPNMQQSVPTTIAPLGGWTMRSALATATSLYLFTRRMPVFANDPYAERDCYTATGQGTRGMTFGTMVYGALR